MKALRSPWVSGVLATLAAVFVGYQLYRGLHSRNRGLGRTPASSVASAPRPTAPVSQAGPAKAAPLPSGSGMDRDFIALHFTNWTAGVKRDPFLLHPSLQQNGTNVSSHLANWKLKAIWHQTGSRVAVLNDALYQEGDMIEGYKIIRIEDEVVWLQNANSLDHVEFRKPQVPVTAATKGTKHPTL